MNNFSMKLKRMFSNKNVVTALCFLLIAVVVIVGYNYRLKQATTPIKVPYALVTIEPQTRITEDMIGTMEIARDAVNKNLSSIYTNVTNITNLYTKLNSTIYKGSFFYKDALVSKDNLPTSALLNIEEGETLLTLNVDMESSYYNSLVPGDYFDLYVRTIGKLNNADDKNNEIIVGKLLSAVKILAVKTQSGDNVFSGDEKRVPAGVLFSIPDNYALLLMKADYFSKLSKDLTIEFTIIPKGQFYEDESGEKVETIISSEKLEKYINDKTADIDIKEIKKNTELGE